jgi:NAD(P)-dependent dehydrogenase (short-subunit alcohol dehydrogenase family)
MADLPLAGKAAIVTGGAVRLGRAIALGLAAHGADVALHYGSSETEAGRTAEEIRALGRKCALVQADLRQADAPRKILDSAGAAFGKADILVNSAAVFERGTMAETTPELWEKTLAVNLRAPFFLSREFAAQAETGDIVFLADARVGRPAADYLAYALTKSALVDLTRSLAKSLAPGIRVNAVSPGAILPPPGRGGEYLQRLIPRIPLGRSGTPDDVVRAVLYLLESSFVTGQVLRVDGGEYI